MSETSLTAVCTDALRAPRQKFEQVAVLISTHSVLPSESNAGDLWIREDEAVTTADFLQCIMGDVGLEFLRGKRNIIIPMSCSATFAVPESLQSWATWAQECVRPRRSFAWAGADLSHRVETELMVCVVIPNLSAGDLLQFTNFVLERWVLHGQNPGSFLAEALNASGLRGGAKVIGMRHYCKGDEIKFAAEVYGYYSEASCPSGVTLEMQCAACGAIRSEEIDKRSRESGFVKSTCKSCKRVVRTPVVPVVGSIPGNAPSGAWKTQQNLLA